ncbi:MAG: U32 family peptidase [Sinobacteraceae bacterium]|nr:U32 family peptidase [Nevskiaceae bacterium]MCP5338673.1 U32 family peptidase [Nevskiaceae bacterium]MCP5473016.1 U32 family peptidase [Nevskiaceae bacterium]
MKLSVGPILYLWERAAALDFYASLCTAPVDIVYVGEVVCSKRRMLTREDWTAVAQRLAAAGKEVVTTTLALLEAESELATLGRQINAASGPFEANDYAAVESANGREFVAGPHLNVYNAATLALLARLGARRWVAPVELPLATLATLAVTRPAGLEIEVFAYGRLPLAFSARCFTARAANRPKDDCGFVCGAHPDGLTLHSRERQPFLALNGIQTQSAAVQNLLPHLPRLRTAGVDVLRLSPQSRDFLDVVRAFDDARQARNGPGLPDTFLSGGYCDGYLDGRAGMERAASAAAATAPP